MSLRDKFALLCAAAVSGAVVLALDLALDQGIGAFRAASFLTEAGVDTPDTNKKFQDRLPVTAVAKLEAPPVLVRETNAAVETPDRTAQEAAAEDADPDVAGPDQDQATDVAHDTSQHEGTEQEAALEIDAGAETSSWQAANAPEPVPAARPRVAATATVKLPWQKGTGTAPAPKTYTLAERIAEISPGASKRIKEKFDEAKVSYPPVELGLVAIKDEKALELHARSATGEWQFVHRYKVLAASGKTGPKLKQGDYQVPEGVYGISFLNPNSKYHVAMRVNFPNAYDKEKASKEGRTSLGGDIMIHGKKSSRGCLAMGDEAAEELFLLAESVGLPNIKLVIAPADFRKSGVPAATEDQPKWVPELYAQIAAAMTPFKAPPPSNSLLSLLGL